MFYLYLLDVIPNILDTVAILSFLALAVGCGYLFIGHVEGEQFREDNEGYQIFDKIFSKFKIKYFLIIFVLSVSILSLFPSSSFRYMIIGTHLIKSFIQTEPDSK